MDIENEIIKEIQYKTCKTCSKSKELSNFRPLNRVCKKCNMEKQVESHLKSNKLYYLKNQEKLKQLNLYNYYKRKDNELLLTETNQHNIVCT